MPSPGQARAAIPKAPNSCLQPPPVPLPSNEGCRPLFHYQPPNAARHITTVDVLNVGQMLRLWGGHFEIRLWGGRFDYGLDVLNAGQTIRLWRRRFDYGVDDSTTGQTIRLWGRRFDCGVCASTLGWTF